MQIAGEETTYEYDGDGSRTKRITNDKTTSYVGSIYEIEEIDDDKKIIKQVYLGSNRLCSIELTYEDGATEPTDSNVYFNHSDHLGSSNIVTDQSGQEVQNYQYTPYGEVASYNETGYNTDKRFAGKTYDESTRSLINFGARMYDYELGRFISPDPTVQKPYDPQTHNRYSYSRGNPIRWVDLDGYGFWSWLKSFFSAFVGAVITAVLSPILTPPIAGMIGGAVAGGLHAALNGQGFGSILKGAMMGGAFGLVMGGMYHGLGPGLGAVFLAGAGIGGAVFAGVTGGGEGLANYGVGALGAFYGGSLGNALANPSGQPQSTEGGISPDAQEAIKESVGTGDFEQIKIAVEEGTGKSKGLSGNIVANESAKAGATGNLGKGKNPDFDADTFMQELRYGKLARDIQAKQYIKAITGLIIEKMLNVKSMVFKSVSWGVEIINGELKIRTGGRGILSHFEEFFKNSPPNEHPTKFHNEWNVYQH